MTDNISQTENQTSPDAAPTEEIQEKKETTGAGAKKAKPAAIRRVKEAKKIRNVAVGRAYIQATYNNTMVSLTDANGSLLAWSSAGHMGFKGPKKATPFAATVIVKEVVEKVRPFGLREVHVFVKGVGGGRESAVRALNANGLNILSIKDVTPLPHNGPRAPKPRRV